MAQALDLRIRSMLLMPFGHDFARVHIFLPLLKTVSGAWHRSCR